jgi:uncharacterized membrane protein YdjX (TVP38/TMEM64 family)
MNLIASKSSFMSEISSVQIKSYKHLYILAFGILGTGAAYLWFYHSPYFAAFSNWAQGYLVALFIILVVIKAIGIVWPPIPGGILTLGSIPIMGWAAAYCADFLGSLIGSCVAYGIARKWGIAFLRKIFDEETIKRMQTVRVVKKREIEAVFLFRLFGGNVVEVVCYAAGLLRVGFTNYLIGTVTSHAAIGIPFYYFSGELFQGRNFLINLIFAAALVCLLIFFKKRYFEKLSDIV